LWRPLRSDSRERLIALAVGRLANKKRHGNYILTDVTTGAAMLLIKLSPALPCSHGFLIFFEKTFKPQQTQKLSLASGRLQYLANEAAYFRRLSFITPYNTK